MPVPLVPVLKSIGGSRGGSPVPRLFLDENEARTKGRKGFFGDRGPPYLRVSPPLYKDLDPPLKRADCILEQLAAR